MNLNRTFFLLVEDNDDQWLIALLLDLYLPDRKDGLQRISRLKTMGDPFYQIPIVMLSGDEFGLFFRFTHY